MMKKEIAPSLPNCPYKNDMFQLNNLSILQGQASYWPEGEYRGIINLTNDLDEKIFAIIFVQSIQNTEDIQEFK